MRKRRKQNFSDVPSIQEVLLEVRMTLGLSQEAIAEKLNVSQRIWSYWENGQRVPKIDNARKIVKMAKKSKKRVTKKNMKFLLDFEAYLISRKQKVNMFFDNILYQEMQEVKRNQAKILKILRGW